jgi:hypothetical protein
MQGAWAPGNIEMMNNTLDVETSDLNTREWISRSIDETTLTVEVQTRKTQYIDDVLTGIAILEWDRAPALGLIGLADHIDQTARLGGISLGHDEEMLKRGYAPWIALLMSFDIKPSAIDEFTDELLKDVPSEARKIVYRRAFKDFFEINDRIGQDFLGGGGTTDQHTQLLELRRLLRFKKEEYTTALYWLHSTSWDLNAATPEWTDLERFTKNLDNMTALVIEVQKKIGMNRMMRHILRPRGSAADLHTSTPALA